MGANVLVSATYFKDNEFTYRAFVEEISTLSNFEDSIWICDKKRRSSAEKPSKYSLYFSRLPDRFKEMIKFFAVIKLIEGGSISNIAEMIRNLHFLSEFAEKLKLENLIEVNNSSGAIKYKQYLDNNYASESAKFTRWNAARKLFDVINVFEGVVLNNAFVNNYYEARQVKKLDNKYISETVMRKLDIILKYNDIPLHWRLMYWILRLIPSRVSEACGVSIDCIKQFKNQWVLFIPTWKQNGGYKQPIMRSIYLEYEGISKFLIDLIKEQQKEATMLQSYLKKEDRGLLFTYKRVYCGSWLKREIEIKEANVFTMTPYYVNTCFKKICVQHDIRDDNDIPVVITSHQFRHNGITDRLENGFTPEQVTLMTGHRGESMIINSYNHVNLNTDGIIEKQKLVNGMISKNQDVPIAFKGKILNIDEELEQRLLSNVRAHKIRGGICSDITRCNCDMFNCLSCSYFIPEIEQLKYFEEQIKLWSEKAERFKAFSIIVKNAQANMALNQAVVDRIRKITEEEHGNEINSGSIKATTSKSKK